MNKKMLLEENDIRGFGKLVGYDNVLVENFLNTYNEVNEMDEEPEDEELPSSDSDMELPDSEQDMGMNEPPEDPEMGEGGEASLHLDKESLDALKNLLQQVVDASEGAGELPSGDGLGGEPSLEEPSDMGGMEDEEPLQEMNPLGAKKHGDHKWKSMGGKKMQQEQDESLEEEVAEQLAENVMRKIQKAQQKKKILSKIDVKKLTENITQRVAKEFLNS